MSHTSVFTIGGTQYAVIHNGDWSGNAEIRWVERGATIPTEVLPPRECSVTIPGELLIAISRYATLSELVGVVENLMGKEAPPMTLDPPPTVTIDINGRKMKAAVYLSYAEIVRIVQPKRPDAILSVTYSRGPKDNREGCLAPGERIGVCEGMHISAYDTSNA